MRHALGLAALAALVLLPVASACVSIDPKTGLAPGDEVDVTDHICTLAFVVADLNGLYFATAGHCIQVGQTAASPVVGKFGVGAFHYLKPESDPQAETDGAPGDDFALIRIDPGYYAKISPSVCGWGGPKGIYTATPVSNGVKHFGHGTLVGEFGPTQQRQGYALTTDANAFYWTGAGVPGDSGSSVLSDDLKAVGVLTHIVISPPADNGGTRLQRGFSLAEKAGFTGLRLVLEGEDPVAVLAQMQANATNAPTPASLSTPTRTNDTNAPGSGNTTAPPQSGSPGASPTPPPSSGQALRPGAVQQEDGAQKATPGPALPLALLAVGLVLLGRRSRK